MKLNTSLMCHSIESHVQIQLAPLEVQNKLTEILNLLGVIILVGWIHLLRSTVYSWSNKRCKVTS